MSQEHWSHKHERHPTRSPLARKSHPARMNRKKGTRGTLRIPSKRSSLLGSADVFNGFKLYVERANCSLVGDRSSWILPRCAQKDHCGALMGMLWCDHSNYRGNPRFWKSNYNGTEKAVNLEFKS